MNRTHLLVGLATLGVAAGATLYTAGIASAHTGGGGLTNARCLTGDAWAVTLNLTGDYLELHPTATITYTGNQMQGAPIPYTHQFTLTGPTFTASAHIVWTDGFTKDVGPFTANRPDGCVPPTTQPGTTTTTTCAMAIPPRGDCGGPIPDATTVPPPTTIAPVVEPTTILPDTTTTSPARAVTPPPTNPPAAHQTVGQLPTTGGTSTMLVALGVVMLAFGAILVGWHALETRRIRKAEQVDS